MFFFRHDTCTYSFFVQDMKLMRGDMGQLFVLWYEPRLSASCFPQGVRRPS